MSNLRIAELDFDDIKANLKAFLQSKPEFTDYDFEGSGLAVLLDILAYNTHYNAYLANMLMNEMFLDSAVKRSSAVSLAKHLGYVPRSARGAQAVVDVVVTNPAGSPGYLTLPAYTAFTSNLDGETLTFVNLEEHITNQVSGSYTFSDVTLTQGQPYSYKFTVANPGPGEKYVIPNELIDTRSLIVTVQTSSTDLTTTTYTQATDITSLTGSSTVYFLQENAQEKFEIYFGDGIVGKQLAAGNIVNVQYIITDGTAGNTSGNFTQSFSTNSTIGGSSNINIVVTSNSVGGADKESIESIKFNAPLVGAAKNRAVTLEDYKNLISSNYTQVESVSVWGGEDNVPPIYGKVIIALKPFSGFVITQALKDQITNSLLKDRKIAAIQPEYVDPEYYYVNLQVSVKYNPNLTTFNDAQVSNLVQNTITSYFNNQVGKFDQDFYTSRLTKSIFDTLPATVSVSPEVRLQKRINPIINIQNSYSGDSSLLFNNRLHPSRFTSSYFYVNVGGVSTLAYIVDIPDAVVLNYDGTGTLKLFNASTNEIINNTFGTINYGTGVVTIPDLTVTGYPNGIGDIRLTCELQEASYDISALRNQVLVLDDSISSTDLGTTQGLTISVTQVIE